MNSNKIKDIVKEQYGKIAAQGACGCFGGCCGGTKTAEDISRKLGYSNEEMKSVPDGSNLGLGCGNPTAFASIKEGDTVVDLGSGAGFDCFIASKHVGKSGKVIGVDMTPEMLERARKNARESGYENVEFVQGEIESLPLPDNSADIVISNCVINLSPDKAKVFKEVHRVLKPGGKLFITDMVLLSELPKEIKESVSSYIGCIAGALLKDDYIRCISDAGFKTVDLLKETKLPVDSVERTGVPAEISRAASSLASSIMVYAQKI